LARSEYRPAEADPDTDGDGYSLADGDCDDDIDEGLDTETHYEDCDDLEDDVLPGIIRADTVFVYTLTDTASSLADAAVFIEHEIEIEFVAFMDCATE
jgi:hypothetical protein